jgi:hypothetical protein
VTEVTTLSRLSVTGNETVTGTLSVSEATTLSSLSVIGNETVGRTLSVTDATTLSSLYVIGNETARRTLSVMEATTLNGNVGTGGASGPDNLLVTGSERVTGNLHVGGDFIVDGSFNYNEVIQNITAVNNEVVISTQLDILNEGTGPALKLTQTGAGDDQDVAVFNAGDEGNTLKIDSSGNSIFLKPVHIDGNLDVIGATTLSSLIVTVGSYDAIFIRRTDAVGQYIHLSQFKLILSP